ncbi:MAG: methyltransferase domain-containing protein [Alphaproteobacteria bacterium]|nr:methyltransferase domain-containing protein [Alphaproteobacteria bacterium]
MTFTVRTLKQFYQTPLGEVVRIYIEDVVHHFLTPLPHHETILGLGYVTPFLPHELHAKNAAMCFTFNQMGCMTWPNAARSTTAIVDAHALPITNQSVDRIILVHALEAAQHPILCIKELQRILKPGGQILIIFPNKNGLWSYSSATPFSYGQHFTSHELSVLLAEHQFQVVFEKKFLYFPPSQMLHTHSLFAPIEVFGAHFLPFFSGLNAICAKKSTLALPTCTAPQSTFLPLKAIKSYDKT